MRERYFSTAIVPGVFFSFGLRYFYLHTSTVNVFNFQILLPHGAYGYDFVREPDEQGQFQYAVLQRQVHHEWARVPVSYGDEVVLPVNRGTKTKLSRIKAQMPGKIVRLLVQEGQKVEKDQPLLVMEAMKMENQIRAPQAGQVTHVKVSEGQAVETGSELILLDPSVD